jgi:hypothetical protein
MGNQKGRLCKIGKNKLSFYKKKKKKKKKRRQIDRQLYLLHDAF